MYRPADSIVWYPLAQRIARWGLAPLVRTRFEGLENLPAAGPCLLVPNHQSILDPLILQMGLSRQVDSMTKSTQFSGLFFRWFLPRIHAFPVRRYRTDPQSVRVALRRLEAGRAVCVYPEGERSWDGRLQPLRTGTLRLILRAGVPVVPIGIDGTFRTWPRWARRPRRGFTAHVRIGKPIHFGAYLNRQEREAALPEAERVLRQALLELSGEAVRTATPRPPMASGLRPDGSPTRAVEPAPSPAASRPRTDGR